MASIAIQDAGGLVDLNTGTSDLLLRVLPAAAGDNTTGKSLFAELKDFRDADTASQGGGDEPVTYPGRNYGPKNGPFAVAEELDQLPSMTEETLRALVPQTTASSQQPGIDPTRAPPKLLALLGGDAQKFQSPSPGRVFRIDVMVELANGTRDRRLADISLERQPDRPFAILAWQRGGDPSGVAPMPGDLPPARIWRQCLRGRETTHEA